MSTAITATAVSIIPARSCVVATVRNTGSGNARIAFDDISVLGSGGGLPLKAGETVVLRMSEWRPAVYAVGDADTTFEVLPHIEAYIR